MGASRASLHCTRCFVCTIRQQVHSASKQMHKLTFLFIGNFPNTARMTPVCLCGQQKPFYGRASFSLFLLPKTPSGAWNILERRKTSMKRKAKMRCNRRVSGPAARKQWSARKEAQRMKTYPVRAVYLHTVVLPRTRNRGA